METQQVIDLMRARLLDLCTDAESIDPSLHPLTQRLRADIPRQFRIAVVGRVKAGKSTLVNALIGRNVAATSAEEATRLVTEYRWGAPYRAEIVLRTGDRRQIPPGDLAANLLPWPLAEISHAEVFLPEAALQHFTLVDTPGLSTTTVENERATRLAVLGADSAERRVDAMVYVFRGNEYADEVNFLKAFAESPTGPGRAAVLGVLSHADIYGTGPWGTEDPMEVARRAASDMAARRYSELSAVIALSGLMAEAARTGLLREEDARALTRLSDISDENLADWDIPTELASAANALADAIGEYGVRHGRAHARRGLADLEAWLISVSGIGLLESALRARNVGRFPLERARAALAELTSAVPGTTERARLRALLAEARLDPALHPIQEFEAWEALRTIDPRSAVLNLLTVCMDAPDDFARVGVSAGSASAIVRDAAIRRAGEAQAAAALAHGSVEVRAASVAARSFGLVAERYA